MASEFDISIPQTTTYTSAFDIILYLAPGGMNRLIIWIGEEAWAEE